MEKVNLEPKEGVVAVNGTMVITLTWKWESGYSYRWYHTNQKSSRCFFSYLYKNSDGLNQRWKNQQTDLLFEENKNNRVHDNVVILQFNTTSAVNMNLIILLFEMEKGNG